MLNHRVIRKGTTQRGSGTIEKAMTDRKTRSGQNAGRFGPVNPVAWACGKEGRLKAAIRQGHLQAPVGMRVKVVSVNADSLNVEMKCECCGIHQRLYGVNVYDVEFDV